MRTGVVVSPEWSDLILTADVPYVELDLLICDCFYIEPDCWDSGHGLAELELIQDGRFARRVKPQHQHS